MWVWVVVVDVEEEVRLAWVVVVDVEGEVVGLFVWLLIPAGGRGRRSSRSTCCGGRACCTKRLICGHDVNDVALTTSLTSLSALTTVDYYVDANVSLSLVL